MRDFQEFFNMYEVLESLFFKVIEISIVFIFFNQHVVIIFLLEHLLDNFKTKLSNLIHVIVLEESLYVLLW